MKINKTYTGFTGVVSTGRYALFILLDKHGVEMTHENLVLTCINYNRVVLLGKDDQDVLEQNNEITKLIKATITKNSSTMFEIHTLGTKRPKGFNAINNTEFIVYPQLKHTGKEFADRIYGEVLSWLNDCDSKFVFSIITKDDFDEVNLLVQDYCIKKSNIYLCPKNLDDKDLQMVKDLAKIVCYNITLAFDKVFW